MDGFQAAVSAIALVELCVKIAKFIRNVQQTAGKVTKELETILNEIGSLQDVTELVTDLFKVFQDLGLQIPTQHTQLLKDLDSGIASVVNECRIFIQEVEAIVQEIRAPGNSAISSRIDAARTVQRSNRRKDDIDRLRRNLRSGQSRLQTFYISLNIIHVQTTAASVKGVTDDIRKLGFQLKHQIALIRTDDDGNAVPQYLSPVARLLASVKLNKHYDVPRSVSGFFTGRQSLLTELKRAFDEPVSERSASPKIFIIHGFPGSGKTDFSFKFAEQYRESFWGVFVMQADSHDLMVNSFKRIVQYADKKVEPNMAAAKHWLANQELPWLLIIDNADDPALEVTTYFPASTSGCILVTTRNRDLRIHGNVGKRFYAFERLEHDEAKTVLLRAADEPNPPRPHADSAASKISEELQCLPLALVSAGKTIRSNLCTWKSYLDWYRKSCDLISRRLSSGSGLKEVEMARLTVIPALEPHFIRLESLKDKASADALELIHTLGYFHHRNISFRLLRLVAKNANKIFILPKEDTDEELTRNSSSGPPDSRKSYKARLTETVIRMASGRTTLPDVLRNLSVDSLDEHRLRAALSKLEDLNLIRCDDEGGGPSYHNRRRHSRRSRGRASEDTESSSDFDDNEQTYSLHPLVHSWIRQRHSSLWRKAVWCEAANAAISQCIVLEAKAFAGEASSYFDAREILPHMNHAKKRKEEIDRQLLNRTSSAGWLRNLLVSMHIIPTGPSWLTEVHLAGRSVKYSLVYGLCGEWQKAADLQSKVRSFVITRRGMNDPMSIYITLALASTMQRLTEFGEAANLQNQAVQACRKVFGPNHPQTLTMIDQYGLLLLYHGRLRECTNLHQEAFNGFTNLGTKYRRQALIAKAHLAAVRAKYLEFTESKLLCQEAIAGLEEIDLNDDELLWAKEALALACGELNEGARACELMRDVHQKREDTLGKQHPFTLWAAVNESRAIWRTKRHEDALKLMEEPRKIAAMTLGRKHFGYLAGETLRACILKDQGQYEEAQTVLTFLDETYDAIKRERGTDHADRIIALGYQFDLYVEQEKHQDAIATGQRMLDALQVINKEGLGWQHPMRPRVQKKMAEQIALREAQTTEAAQSDLNPASGLRLRRLSSQDTPVGQNLMDFRAVDP